MRTLSIMIVCAFLSTTLFSQNSVWVVYSENKCHQGHMDDLVQMTTDKWGPIMNEVVEEAKWVDWGILEHAWGNEWNWNVYYVAEDRESFFEGWDLMIKKMNEKHPGWFDEFEDWCFEHKDSMHSQRFGYSLNQGDSGN